MGNFFANATPLFGAAWPPKDKRVPPNLPAIAADQPSGPYASCWATDQYQSKLTFTPPSKPDVMFHRGSFARVRVPGFVNGNNDKDRSLMMTWELPTYSSSDQQLCIAHYASLGYTHILLSIPQTRNNGRNVLDLLTTALLCRQYGLFVVVAVFDEGQTLDDVREWLDPLTAAGVVSIFVVCWQGDKWFAPYDLTKITIDLSEYAKPFGILLAMHWVNDACAWWNPADDPREDSTCKVYGFCDRFGFQRFMAGENGSYPGQKIHFQYIQGDHNGAVNDFQWNIGKVMESLQGLANPIYAVYAEGEAQGDYDDPRHRLEIYGDLKGYLLGCTNYHNQIVMGSFDGWLWELEGQ